VQQRSVFRLQEACGDGGVEKSKQAIPVVGRVDEDDRFGVEAKLGPGDDFEQFFESAVAAGKDEESVAELGHAGFALVHGFYIFEAREPAVGDLPAGENVRKDADDGCTRGKCRVGDGAHETGVGSAVDKTQPGRGDGLAEG